MKSSNRNNWFITICGLAVLFICVSGRADIIDEGRRLEDDGKNKADNIENHVVESTDANKRDTVVIGDALQVKADDGKKDETQQ